MPVPSASLEPLLAAIWRLCLWGALAGLLLVLGLVLRRWLEERRPHRAPEAARALRQRLLGALAGGDWRAALPLLAGRPAGELAALVDELAQIVRGEVRERLVALACALDLPEQLRADLRSWRPGVRALAASRLSLFADADSEAALRRALGDRDPQVRLAAAESLAGRSSARALVAESVRSDPVFVRSAAKRFWHLLAVRDPELFARCFDAAPDPGRRRLLIEAAAAAGLVRFAPAMVEASVSGDPDLRRTATAALLALHHPAAHAALERLFLDPEPDQRAEALALVARGRLARFAPQVLQRLEDPDPLVRARARETAVRLGLPLPAGVGPAATAEDVS